MEKANSRKKIVMTGGHAAATGYAVIQEIEGRYKDWEVYWLGAKKAVEGKKVKTLEGVVFSQMNIRFIAIFTGRLQTKFSLWTIPSLLKIPVGFVLSFLHLVRIKPNAVVSFGGYVAVPVVFSAWLLRIAVVIHEQTAEVGRANLFSKHFARKILISRTSSKKYFPEEKVILVGNPISKEVQSIKVKEKLTKEPTVFIAGGSRGSVSINKKIEDVLDKVLNEFRLIHQTGEYQYDYFLNLRKKLKPAYKKRYEVVGVVPPWEWHKLLDKADIVIGRSGANFVSEVMVAKRPSIFIPLPIAYKNEQMENAKHAAKFGIAIIIEQRKLSSEKLLKALEFVKKNWEKMLAKASKYKSPDREASALFINEVEKILS